MPIFHQDYDQKPARAATSGDGTQDDDKEVEHDMERDGPAPRGWLSFLSESRTTSPVLDRGELIERIKRGESPSWTPTRSHKSPEHCKLPQPSSRGSPTPKLLAPLQIRTSRPSSPELTRDAMKAGMEIERPRSALHSGDFREKTEPSTATDTANTSLATSPVAPWHPSFPASLRVTQSDLSEIRRPELQYPAQTRARAISQSSLNFAFMPPTSPLAQQLPPPDDGDFASTIMPKTISRSPERASRRHTFSPQSFQTYRYSPYESHQMTPRMPYQAHQPRRSMSNAMSLHSSSVPRTPPLRARRPSISSESSPHLQHAPMVGSYEESILRGRMSTIPSRPLDFVAQIGVLGKGNCKASLRCPPHVTVPFPAVFYNYGSGGGKILENQPSPYVGLVDLENSLPPPDEDREGRRKRRHAGLTAENTAAESNNESRERTRRREKLKRRRSRSSSPKAPPGGSYRIPAQGQLQIVIKNPNKTAVKLFLVPYDLSDMPIGSKTFIRQRSYSAGPIIDMPLASRKNLGTDRPEASLSNSEDPADRPVLRYLVHLHMCCTGKGRYYLYRSVRVVFANRVPDGKEKLRNEVQLPDPKYSSYKPVRTVVQEPQMSALAADKAYRRRSVNVSFPPWPPERMDEMDGLPQPAYSSFSTRNDTSFDNNSELPSVQSIPFRLPAVELRPVSRGEQMDVDVRSRPSTAGRADEETVSLTRELGEFGKRKEWSSPSSSESLLGRGLRSEFGNLHG